jgi:16S rRNA C967 or C1407 C5-methylase (RsmB/RsmF family)
MCCAPGAKLLYIADLLPDGAKVVGVDISKNRLNVTRSLVKKYKQTNVEIVEADGTSYQSDELFDKVLVDAECTHEGSLKHLQKYFSEDNKNS